MFVITFSQVMINGYPVIKHKTLTLPQAIFLVNFFQVVEDAAL